jgi:transcription initiation factor IIE alpha subunit
MTAQGEAKMTAVRMHVTQDGRKIALKNMETTHVLNLRRFLKHKHRWYRELIAKDREEAPEHGWFCTECDHETEDHQVACPKCGETDVYVDNRHYADSKLRRVNKELRRRRAGKLRPGEGA